MLLKIAWRNLWRNRRRTQLTMGAMVFTCAMLVFSLGYYDGMLWNMINNATDRENGHICLARPGYLDSPTINDTISEKEAVRAIESSGISSRGFCPRISVFSLLSCGSESENRTQPAQILGVDSAAEVRTSRLADEVCTGSFLSGAGGEILLGKGLARKLNASVGSEIVFFSSAADGSMASALLHVKGIFSSGDTLRDSSLAMLNITELRRLMVLEGQIHSLRVFIADPMKADRMAAELGRANPGIEVRGWRSIFPQLADLVAIWLNVQIVTTLIFYAALALITFNTMYMAFLERRHEFAVMQAIGLTRPHLAMLVLFESMIMASLSGLIGTVAGTAINLSLFYRPIDLTHWINNISWGGTQLKAQIFCIPTGLSAAIPMLTMLILGVLVAALPTYRLYRLKPAEALREG